MYIYKYFTDYVRKTYVSFTKEYAFVRFVKTFPCVAVYMSSLTNMAIAVDRYQVIVRTQSLQVINIYTAFTLSIDCIYL